MQVSIELNFYYFFVVAVKGVSNALYNGIWLSGNGEEFNDTFNILLVGLEGSIKPGILETSPPKRRKKPRGAPGEVMKTHCFVDPGFKSVISSLLPLLKYDILALIASILLLVPFGKRLCSPLPWGNPLTAGPCYLDKSSFRSKCHS